MVKIAADHTFQRGADSCFDGIIEVQTPRVNRIADKKRPPRWDLRPDEQADFIGNVEIQRIGWFDVAAQTVQAERFGFGKLIADIVPGWYGVDCVGIIIL